MKSVRSSRVRRLVVHSRALDAGVHSAEATPESTAICLSAWAGATLSIGSEGFGDSTNRRYEGMSVFFLIVLIVLFLGPLRSPFFRHWRFTVPAAVGFVFGLGVGVFAAKMARLPDAAAGLVGLVVATGLAFSFGGAFKGWCDKVLGQGQQQQHREQGAFRQQQNQSGESR